MLKNNNLQKKKQKIPVIDNSDCNTFKCLETIIFTKEIFCITEHFSKMDISFISQSDFNVFTSFFKIRWQKDILQVMIFISDLCFLLSFTNCVKISSMNALLETSTAPYFYMAIFFFPLHHSKRCLHTYAIINLSRGQENNLPICECLTKYSAILYVYDYLKLLCNIVCSLASFFFGL